jgi:hypothetical protein
VQVVLVPDTNFKSSFQSKRIVVNCTMYVDTVSTVFECTITHTATQEYKFTGYILHVAMNLKVRTVTLQMLRSIEHGY